MKKEWIQKNISPNLLLLSGVLLIITFIFQKNLMVKAVQVLLFMFFTFLAGNKIKLLNSFLILTFIVFFNLLTPAGRVLFYFGIFPVTELALSNGIIKGLTFIGLFYISKSFISRNINFPGTFGRLISRTFYYLNELTREKSSSMKEPIKSLDEIMLKVYYSPNKTGITDFVTTSPQGITFISALIIINTVFLLLYR
jgi:hypothetical protein